MTDQPFDLPAPEGLDPEVHIPAVLAAPKPKKLVMQKAAIPVIDVPAAEFHPIAAAPADTLIEETNMATNFETVGENTVEAITHNASEKVQAFAADLNGRGKDAMEKSTKFLAEMTSFGKGNVEALVESGKLVVAGVQTMAQNQAAYARKQFEDATAAARTLTGVKSPTEFVKLQGDFVRQQFDGAVAEMSRSTEAMLKLAGEVVQPISNRVAVAVERIKMAA